MDAFFMILGLIAVIVGIAMVTNEDSSGVLLSIIGAIVFTVCLMETLSDNKPTALDVYRGKTTLEITYRDSVAIDSTVVYKVR